MRRWLANLIYPEGRHLRMHDLASDDFTRRWNACARLWNETARRRWAREKSR